VDHYQAIETCDQAGAAKRLSTSPSTIIPHHDLCRRRDDFVVVSSCFNPRGYKRRYDLFREFRQRMDAAGVTFVAVEVALGDRPCEVTKESNPLDVQLRTRWELWHKEAALNVGIHHAIRRDPDCRYIAWIDADVTFATHDWPAAVCEALQHWKVVQMFGSAVDMDADEHPIRYATSAMKAAHDLGYHFERGDAQAYGHPGLAWAFRRSTLDRLGGLMDFALSGANDLHMSNAFVGAIERGDHEQGLSQLSPGFAMALRRWAIRARHVVVPSVDVGYLSGTLMHHWHGNTANRGYLSRWEIEKRHQFDPYTDLVRETTGLYGLAPGREKLGDDLRRTLAQRNEDGLE
jgi:hypothetical protein